MLIQNDLINSYRSCCYYWYTAYSYSCYTSSSILVGSTATVTAIDFAGDCGGGCCYCFDCFDAVVFDCLLVDWAVIAC